MLQSYDGLKARETKIPKEAKVRLAEALDRLVQLYSAWEKPTKAAQWQRQLEATGTNPKKSRQ